tara:strand:+ start:218 stop:628 length:411 start_codon:yes stop_codon:yes gene_type:complete
MKKNGLRKGDNIMKIKKYTKRQLEKKLAEEKEKMRKRYERNDKKHLRSLVCQLLDAEKVCRSWIPFWNKNVDDDSGPTYAYSEYWNDNVPYTPLQVQVLRRHADAYIELKRLVDRTGLSVPKSISKIQNRGDFYVV